MIAPQFVYLVALTPFCLIWIILFVKRPDLRKEMLFMSVLIGILSVATCHYWWTLDWWKPIGLFGSRTFIEDFVMGFTTGGIMASIYEVIFKRGLYKRKLHHHISGGLTILLILAQITSWLMYGVGISSFWASTVAMTLVAAIMLFIRRDLFTDALLSGVLMFVISSLFYYTIILLSPGWIIHTYLPSLSGIRLTGIPIEELVFWFLSGVVFGPFYEYWQGERLKKYKTL